MNFGGGGFHENASFTYDNPGQKRGVQQTGRTPRTTCSNASLTAERPTSHSSNKLVPDALLSWTDCWRAITACAKATGGCPRPTEMRLDDHISRLADLQSRLDASNSGPQLVPANVTSATEETAAWMLSPWPLPAVCLDRNHRRRRR